ncbi:HERC4 [Symbiodinium microadriaticum]|nr:HERC4 [Symbiodinium microadriaticum]
MALRFLLGLLAFGSADASLRGQMQAAAGSVSAEKLRETVLSEVMMALGSGNRVTEQRLQVIEEALKSTFQAMPKNSHGNLGDETARYVLHRLFVQRHAMYIKGLEAAGMTWQNLSTTQVLEEHIPAFVLSLFEERLKGVGLGLHELSILAATLEHLIHDEAVSRLSVVYQAHNYTEESRVDEFELQNLIDTYMSIFLLGTQDISASSVAAERQTVLESYPGWKDTQKFTVQVRTGLTSSRNDADFVQGNFSFRAATQIVEEIGERYGRWQDAECRDLKSLLMKIEHADTGRVLLKDFYGSALDGNWQFSESVDYLRELGALDESDPANKAVLIANYVNSHSNCVASSSIYSVCCVNECEALLGHLERQVAAPDADPDQLVKLVEQLPSATIPAPRELSANLQGRLHEVASHHGGTVPLHGRLFAQWLHHAFPRECPYPHVSGKTNPMTADAWMQAKGLSVSASKEDMTHYVSQAQTSQPAQELPWTGEEELLAGIRPRVGRSRSILQSCVLLIAMLSACLAFGHSTWSKFSTARDRCTLLPYTQKQHAC